MALPMRYGLFSASCIQVLLTYSLREAFSPDLPVSVLPAHLFVKSIHNTTIERGWLRMRLQWGDNVIVFWEAGSDRYNSTDPNQ
jgi:hypothetical protein